MSIHEPKPQKKGKTVANQREVGRRLKAAHLATEHVWSPPPEEAKRILKARAQALAREPERAETSDERVEIVTFLLAYETYGIETSYGREVHPLKDLAPLPCTPAFVAGVVNIQGRIVPIINVRRRFHLPEREIALTDQIVIAHTSRRPVGLVVDAVIDVIDFLEQGIASAESILPDMEYVEGVVKLQDGLVLIHDLDKFLSLEEETSLTQAMETT